MARVCAVPGCPELAVDRRHCDEHRDKPKPGQPKAKRLSAHRRGYGHKWREASREFLLDNPWCVMCERLGLDVRAADVDHIEPWNLDGVQDWAKFWDKSNWQPLCRPHHSKKTRWDEKLSA